MIEDKLRQRISLWNAISSEPVAVDGDATERLRECFIDDIKFGTSGLRGEMAPGFAKINDVTIQLATQGICAFLIETRDTPGAPIVIGYDHRHNSERFAMIAALTVLRASLDPILLDGPIPTPLLAYSVLHFKAAFGIMITASHNPACDNGYKVYGENGAQVASDASVSNCIREQNYGLWTLEGAIERISPPWGEYCAEIVGNSYSPPRGSKPPLIVHTALHGVANGFVRKLLEAASLAPLIPTVEQMDPNPDFPTVFFPNPEEGECAFKLAFETAARHSAPLVFASDPDCDRFSMAEVQPRIFSGNEIAAIFAAWLYEREKNKSKKIAMVGTHVSSSIVSEIARIEQFHYESAETGFKNVANAAQKLEKDGYKVLLCFEEAIGYMVGTTVWDKDGLSALLLAYGIAIDVYEKSSSFAQMLGKIYSRYGCFVQYNTCSLYSCRDEAQRAFQSIRKSSACFADHRKDFSPSAFVKFYLTKDETSWVSVRASGTEAKVKYYSESRCLNQNDQGQKLAELKAFVQRLMSESEM